MYNKIVKKKLVAGAIGLLSIISWQVSVQDKTSYTVARVIDGDTFETVEKQRIRLAGVEAPELELCGGEEAKQVLEKIILNKKVQLKTIYNDTFKRLVSLVYMDDKFVNKEVLASGWAYSNNISRESAEEMLVANQEARKKNLGIFSSKCTQSVNPINPKCNIKGNRANGVMAKTYHFPGCDRYELTKVQLYLDDKWFCSEKEAISAGYKKASGCEDKKY